MGVRTYRRGLRCCLFGYDGNTRASEAEQQQCSPAFLCVKKRNMVSGPPLFSVLYVAEAL